MRPASWVLLFLLLLGSCTPASRVPGALPADQARDVPALLKWAGQLEVAGRDGEAELAYRRALGLESRPGPQEEILHRGLAAAERLEHPASALEWSELLRERQLPGCELELRHSVLLARSGKEAEARSRVQEALAEGRCPPARAQLAMGWIDLYGGQLVRAVHLARLAAGQGQAGGALLGGVALLRQGRLPAAAALLRQARQQDPAAWEPRFLLAVVLLAGGKLEAAENELAEVVALRPGDGRVRLWYGLASLLRRRDAEAAQRLAEAVADGELRAHWPLAQLLELRGEEGRAAEHREAYRRAFPGAAAPPGTESAVPGDHEAASPVLPAPEPGGSAPQPGGP